MITVYDKVKYLPHVYPELNLEVNLVDIPGLQDSREGGDQIILDMMKEKMKIACPQINIFVLCFEKGKFDAGFQTIIQTYRNLLDNEEKIWTNMIAVITKVGWCVDYDEIEEWEEEMDEYKKNLENEFKRRYGENATPTVIAISQDIKRPKIKENKPNTEQNNLMVANMMEVYQKARFKFDKQDFIDCSNLKYTMS